MPRPSHLHARWSSRLAVVLAALVLAGAASHLGSASARADGIGISVSMFSSPTIGVPFTLEFGAHGGTPPYTWSVVDGALPPGLVLLDTGEVTGTPAAADVASTFTVRVVDAEQRVAESTITLHAGNWSPPPLDDRTQTSIDGACSAELARAFRLPVMRLCERYGDPAASDLSRYIIGSMLERLSSLPTMLWMP